MSVYYTTAHFVHQHEAKYLLVSTAFTFIQAIIFLKCIQCSGFKVLGIKKYCKTQAYWDSILEKALWIATFPCPPSFGYLCHAGKVYNQEWKALWVTSSSNWVLGLAFVAASRLSPTLWRQHAKGGKPVPLDFNFNTLVPRNRNCAAFLGLFVISCCESLCMAWPGAASCQKTDQKQKPQCPPRFSNVLITTVS